MRSNPSSDAADLPPVRALELWEEALLIFSQYQERHLGQLKAELVAAGFEDGNDPAEAAYSHLRDLDPKTGLLLLEAADSQLQLNHLERANPLSVVRALISAITEG